METIVCVDRRELGRVHETLYWYEGSRLQRAVDYVSQSIGDRGIEIISGQATILITQLCLQKFGWPETVNDWAEWVEVVGDWLLEELG